MKDMKIVSKNNIEAIIINKYGLGSEKLSSILAKYEEIEVAGIINPMRQNESHYVLRRVPISKGKSISILNPLDITYLAAEKAEQIDYGLYMALALYFTHDCVAQWYNTRNKRLLLIKYCQRINSQVSSIPEL